MTQPPPQPKTLHVFYNHECRKCKAYYIPYDEDVPCPRCGIVENERYDFVPRAVQSARFNLMNYGVYLPGVWHVGSLGDFALYLLFELLEADRKEASAIPFDELAEHMLESTDMADKPYLRPHIHGLAMRVYDELKKRAAAEQPPA